MEFAVGQFTQNGPIGALAKICPILKGFIKSTGYINKENFSNTNKI